MAVVERAIGGFNAFFPALPHCIASGYNLEQLRQNAEGALFDYLELSAAMQATMLRTLTTAIPHGPAVARMIIEPKGH